MKFSEIIESPGGYWNFSNSFFLVLGIADQNYPTPTGVGNFVTQNGILFDSEGSIADVFSTVIIQVKSWNSTMTVWNGTAMESEPITLYTSTSTVIQKEKMLIPPYYKLMDFGIAYGFWMTVEEVEQMLGIKKDELKDIKNWGAIKI